MNKTLIYKGSPASLGIGIGRIFHFKSESEFVFKENIDKKNIDKELQRFKKALSLSIKELTKLKNKVEKNRGKASAIIIETQIYLLKDDELINSIESIIKNDKVKTEWAIHQIKLKYEKIFSDLENDYLSGRIVDLKDSLNRVLKNLQFLQPKEKKLPEKTPLIIVAEDLPPSEMAYYTTHAKIEGIILFKGGSNSHTVILAKALEIPTIINVDFDEKPFLDGMEAIVDATEGDIYINPTLSIKKEFINKKEQFGVYRKGLKSVKNLPSITKDNENFKIMANIEVPEEIDLALSYGAEGIGLFRTEFLYMLETKPPTLDKQIKIYKGVLSKMDNMPVVIRTLDIGGEKNIETFNIGKEENPALGLRAIRYFLKEKKHFYIQLKAILKAAEHHKVKILFPMITEIEELRELKDMVFHIAKKESIDRENYDIGIMVETPSVALTIDSYIDEVDYVSIGTNDLIQYTLAVDRANSMVNYLYKPLNPAVLRLLKYVADEGKKGGIDVQLCGEMASKPIYAIVLLGLGIKSISMTSQAIPIIKRILRSVSLKKTTRIMKEAIKLSSANEVDEFIVENLLNKCPTSLFENILPLKL